VCVCVRACAFVCVFLRAHELCALVTAGFNTAEARQVTPNSMHTILFYAHIDYAHMHLNMHTTPSCCFLLM
jgi:hypothetical protein